jgi:DNA polymerase-1
VFGISEDTDEEQEKEEADPSRFHEAQVMLWLLSSEFTNPTMADILAFTKQRDFKKAYTALEKELAKASRVKEVYEKIEKPLIPVVRAMEERGVLIDTKMLADLEKRYKTELGKIEKRIYKAAGREFNVSSPQQLGVVLFDELALKPERQKMTAGGARSTRESELEKIKDQHPIVEDILEYRQVKKLLSTYIENLPPLLDPQHRLHAEFSQTGTTTGRMSSQNPNLQNIPLHSERGRAIRNAFIAPKGHVLIALDYSQIELRIAAILSGDEKLQAVFKGGRDVHREVAAMVFGVKPEDVDLEMRRRAKVINFGILYGMGVNALKAQLGVSQAEARKFLDDYFDTFTTLTEYLEKTKGFARKHGYTETLFGRRRQFPEIKSPLPYVRAQAERMAINAPMQGTQADIIKLAMVQIDKELTTKKLRDDTHLLLQVHDELVYEVRKEKVEEAGTLIKNIMESVVSEKETNGVPIIASLKTGPSWGELHVV